MYPKEKIAELSTLFSAQSFISQPLGYGRIGLGSSGNWASSEGYLCLPAAFLGIFSLYFMPRGELRLQKIWSEELNDNWSALQTVLLNYSCSEFPIQQFQLYTEEAVQ